MCQDAADLDAFGLELTQFPAPMFDLRRGHSIKRGSTPELFREQSVVEQAVETSFIFERSSLFSNPSFQNVACLHDLGKKEPKKELSEEDVYESNNGTTLTISVGNRIIIASDTRHSSDYTINSRRMTKIYRIGNYFLTAAGFFADGFELYTKLLYRMRLYETYNKMSLGALAHLLHNILYSRRFFPYYSYVCLSGFESGKATIYSFDCVGSYQETKCRCDGSASKMIQPLLDSWVSGKNFENFRELCFEDALKLVKRAFDGAAERDVKTKDFLEIYVLDGDLVNHQVVSLRKD